MSDLMFDIMMWVILIVGIAVCIFKLFIIFYGIYYLMTNSTKKELKDYTVRYSVKGFNGYFCVQAKNKKQAIKEFHRNFNICEVKEIR